MSRFSDNLIGCLGYYTNYNFYHSTVGISSCDEEKCQKLQGGCICKEVSENEMNVSVMHNYIILMHRNHVQSLYYEGTFAKRLRSHTTDLTVTCHLNNFLKL